MEKKAIKNRSWDVLLLGGASGVGKTSVSYALAYDFRVGITEVDDLYIVLEQLTTPEQQPLLHFWQTDPKAATLTLDQIVDHHVKVSRLLTPAIKAVINNHLETKTPIVLEGDYLLPELFDPNGDRFKSDQQVQAVFLYEPDEKQILQNYLLREPEEGEQRGRARVSWLYGQWLKDECERYGLIALAARPWDSLIERIKDEIS